MTALDELPISSAARRALEGAGIFTLQDAAARQRSDIAAIRGVGAQALAAIEAALKAEGLGFGTPITVAATSSTTVTGEGASPAAGPSGYAQPPISGLSSAVPPGPGYNPLAIIGFLLAFAFPPVGIVLGHIALGQIAKRGEKGREISIAALIIGYVLSFFMLMAFIVWLVAMIAVFGVIASIAPGISPTELPPVPFPTPR